MARVLVTDAGRGSAISIIRSLGRAGHQVVAADSDRDSPGFASRHTSASVVYPSPRRAPAETADALLRAAVEHGVDLIVPVTDDVLLPLSASRERFEAACAVAMADAEALQATQDKQATMELARRLDVPVPATETVTSAEEAVVAASRLGWPVVVKPQASRLPGPGGELEPVGVRYAESSEQLTREMRPLEGRCSVLLQEYVPGEAYGVELLLDNGRPLAAFQHRRVREVPLSGGASSCRESVDLDPALFGYAAAMLGELRWTGLAMVEFKVGRNGPSLMEINGRIWGSLPLAVRAGVDFPLHLARLYLNGESPAAPIAAYPAGVRCRNLELEVVWILSVLAARSRYRFLALPPRWEAIAPALRLFWPPDGYDILSVDDPRPGLRELRKIVRKVWGEISNGG
jgi:predicted ATP-grasp superfamily ATP-dependent carboligase